MRRFLTATLLMMSWLVPATAADDHCAADIKAVDAALAKAKLSDPDAAKVKAARAKADELLKAKKDEECEKSLAEAQKILGIKDPHKH